MSATRERKRRSIRRDGSDGWLLPSPSNRTSSRRPSSRHRPLPDRSGGTNDRRRGEPLGSALVTSLLYARVERGDAVFVPVDIGTEALRVEADHPRTTDSFEMGRA
jgi:hypothetical protein